MPRVDDDVVLSAPLFSSIEPEAAGALRATMTLVTLERGDVLFREGEPGDRLYVIATATAVADTSLYELEHSGLVAWIEQHPGVATHLLGALAGRLRRTNEAVADLIFSDVPGRVAKSLLGLSERFGSPVADGIRVAHDLTQEAVSYTH